MKNRKIMMILAASLCLSMTVSVMAEEADAEETVEETVAEEAADAEETEEETSAEEETADEESADAEEVEEESAPAKPEKVAIPRLISEEDLDDYLTLGDYKGIDIEAVQTSVSDEDVEYEISQRLADSPVQVTNGTVQTGDTAVISYIGKKDGVAFEGGTADNYPLQIGSGTFIDGFEDGLIGMEVGETKDLNLTFPEYYHSEELAGADVVFTVTVNRINRPAELTDEWVQENSDSETVDEYKEALRKELEKEQESQAEQQLAQEGIYQVWVSTEIKGYPEKELQVAKDLYTKQFEAYAQMGGMTLEQFVESQGSNMEEFEQYIDEIAKQRIAQDLIVQSIIDTEEIPMDDEVIQEIAQKLLADYGYDSLEELMSVYSEDEVYATIALLRVEKLILENANIVEPEEEPEDEETEDGLTVEEIEASEEDASEEVASEITEESEEETADETAE